MLIENSEDKAMFTQKLVDCLVLTLKYNYQCKFNTSRMLSLKCIYRLISSLMLQLSRKSQEVKLMEQLHKFLD